MIKLIAAISKNKQIGLANKMPWHIPEDLAYFRKVTTGKTILMGRKTFESIGFPLPNRENIILTKNPNFKPEGVRVIHSMEEALSLCHDLEEIFIIGGGEIYSLFLPYADELYLTLIDIIVEGDTCFPEFEETFKCIHSTPGNSTDIKQPTFSFTIWARK